MGALGLSAWTRGPGKDEMISIVLHGGKCSSAKNVLKIDVGVEI